MRNMSNPNDRKALEAMIKDDIEQYSRDTWLEGHREHLGASVMGDVCSRRLFSIFRWFKKEDYSGRMLRLFQVGHNAEPRFISYLRGIGFKVYERDQNTGKQFRISACNSHYGGSLDGKCEAPERYQISEQLIFLNEFKTNGTGAGFTNVEIKGVDREKPKHFAQMCQYGFMEKLKYALYIIENKNDSELIVKIVELDWQLGEILVKKAADIISSNIPPPKIAENPAFFECKWCNYAGICWNGEAVEINCRSCKHASPIEAGQWRCGKWNSVIPSSEVKKGCSSHESIAT